MKIADAFFGGDVACDDLEIREFFFEHLDAVDDADALTVGGIDHDEVHSGFHEGFGTFVWLAEGANCGSAYEAAFVIFCGVGVSFDFFDVFDRDEALEIAIFVHDGEFFDPVLGKESLGLVESCAGLTGDEVFGRHSVRDAAGEVGFKSDVAVGEDADEFAFVIGDGNPANMKMLHEVDGLLEHFVGGELDRVGNDPVLGAFDPIYLAGLFFDWHVAVEYAYSAFSGDGDGKPSFGHGIHRGGYDGSGEADAGKEFGRSVDLGGKNIGSTWEEEHVVEAESLAEGCHNVRFSMPGFCGLGGALWAGVE